jgi:hypothetical protein
MQHHNATSVTKYKKIHGRGFEKCCYWLDPIYQRITAAAMCVAQEHAVQPYNKARVVLKIQADRTCL